MEHLLDQYDREVTVSYQNEEYLVRDNGAVLRKHRPGQRKRKADETWTFGKENTANPYLHISGVRIHRIVATAFHGEPSDPKYVVDHIDSNCRNNRPENLRWLTRLENALKNPATRKKIEYLCGSIEAFLENPSMLNELRDEPNFTWMRTVSKEEAENCKARMSLWAAKENKETKSTNPIKPKRSFEERIYRPLKKWEVGLDGKPGLDLALTRWCATYMWRAPAYFPCCPEDIGEKAIEEYLQNLRSGFVLSHSDEEDMCPRLTVVKATILESQSSILVLCERADSKWSVVAISFDKRSRHFIHFILGTYLQKDEAEKAFLSKSPSTNFWSEGYANYG